MTDFLQSAEQYIFLLPSKRNGFVQPAQSRVLPPLRFATAKLHSREQ
jgi:hypothetical protein